MMANAGNSSEGGVPRSRNLLDKIKSWDEAMQWSERYVKAQGDAEFETEDLNPSRRTLAAASAGRS